MYSLDHDLEDKLRKFNKKVKKSHERIFNIGQENLRGFIMDHIGSIQRAQKPSRQTYQAYEQAGGIVGVDGSVNRKGGASPHYIEIFRALAKSSIKSSQEILKTQVYSPILDMELLEDEEVENKRDQILSTMELEVAIEAAKSLDPFLIMMDGSFIRYIIDSREKWEELRYICEDKDILLIGVIEDIKTHVIGSELVVRDYTDIKVYDREILFGRLEVGEYILIDDSKKSRAGQLKSALMRSSNDPNIIGIDIIDTQRSRLEEMVNLVYGLTPINSRGVPIWLDIVDEEVKISHRAMEAYLETYLDRDIYERFFLETRSKR